MATTTLLSGLDLTKWRADFMRESVRGSSFEPYMGDSPNDIVSVMNDLKTNGYTIRVPLVGKLNSAGVSGNSQLSGSEEELGQYYQDISWDFYRHAIAATKKEQKKSAVELMAVARPLLKEWAAELIKYQLIGSFHKMTDGTLYSAASAGTKNTFTVNNVDRILFGAATSNYSATHATALANVDNTSDKLTTPTASLARFIARNARPMIKPYKTEDGREYYVMFCHPLCFRDLKTDTAMIAANRDARAREGSAMDKNPIFQDGDMIYDGIIFREVPEFYRGKLAGTVNTDTHLVNAGASATTDVGVNFLCGAQALGFANKQSPLPTTKKEDDYGFVDGVGIELAHGIDKLRWGNNTAGANSAKDVGVVTVYCAAVAG